MIFNASCAVNISIVHIVVVIDIMQSVNLRDNQQYLLFLR